MLLCVLLKKGYFVLLRILLKKSCVNENSELAKHVISSDLDVRDYVRKVLLIEALILWKMITCNQARSQDLEKGGAILKE